MYLLIHKINIFYSVCAGKGHTMSFASSGQNSRILLCKYHWRSSGSPGGTINGGILLIDGSHEKSFKMLIFVSSSSLAVRTNTNLGSLLRCSKVLVSTDPLDGSGVLLKNAAPVIKLHKCVTIIITN